MEIKKVLHLFSASIIVLGGSSIDSNEPIKKKQQSVLPSSTFSSSTSVGTVATKRFCKVVSYQSAPQNQLPEALKNENPRGIIRLLNGMYTTNKLV